MSVYKELGYVARNIEEQSEQIYSDACDYGVPIYSMNDPILEKVRQMRDWYNPEIKVSHYSTGFTQTLEFHNGLGQRLEAGASHIDIVYVGFKKEIDGMIGYLYVHSYTPSDIEQEYVAHEAKYDS